MILLLDGLHFLYFFGFFCILDCRFGKRIKPHDLTVSNCPISFRPNSAIRSLTNADGNASYSARVSVKSRLRPDVIFSVRNQRRGRVPETTCINHIRDI